MKKILELSSLILISAIKFFLAPGTIALKGYNFWETIIISTIGGIVGVLFFYYFGVWATKQYKKLKNKINFLLFGQIVRKKKKVFTKSRRIQVKIRKKYGIIGIAVLTPIFLSIPIGSIIAARYFSRNKLTVIYLLLAVIFWSFTLTSFIFVIT